MCRFCPVDPQALRDSPARCAPITVGYIYEAADAAQQVCFIVVQHAIGVNNLPKHLDDRDSLLGGIGLLDRAREANEMVAVVVNGFRLGDKVVRLGIIQPEMPR